MTFSMIVSVVETIIINQNFINKVLTVLLLSRNLFWLVDFGCYGSPRLVTKKVNLEPWLADATLLTGDEYNSAEIAVVCTYICQKIKMQAPKGL